MSEDSSDLSNLVSSAVLVLVGMLFGSFSKLIERVIIARWVTVDAYGEVSVGLAIMNLTVALTLLGFNQGIPRYVPRFDDERDIRGIWATGLLIGGVLAVLAAVVISLNMSVLISTLFETAESQRLLGLFVLCIPFIVGLRVGVGAIRGFENTLYRTYSRDLLYTGVRLTVLVGLLATGMGVLAAGYAYLVAAIVAFLAAHLLLNRLFPLLGQVRLHPRKLVAFSTPLVVSTIISILLMETDTLMLGYFKSSTQVALYGAAFPLARGIPVIVGAFGYLYFPLASRLDVSDERAEMETIYQLTTKWGVVLMFPLFLTFLAFPGDVLRIVFRAEYAQGGLALSILATGFFARGFFGRNGDTLSALGHPRYVLLASVVAYVLNVVLNLVLIPQYGYVGASLTSALASVTLNLLMYGVLRLKFGITPFSRWTRRTLLVLIAVLVPSTLALSSVVSLTIVTLPIFLVCAGIAAVGLIAVTGSLQAEDRIPLELVETKLGIHVPLLRRFLPEA